MPLPKYFLTSIMFLIFTVIFIIDLPDYNQFITLTIGFVLFLFSLSFMLLGIKELENVNL